MPFTIIIFSNMHQEQHFNIRSILKDYLLG